MAALGLALRRALWLVLCALLPVVAVYYAIGPLGGTQAVDFHFNYYLAAEAIRDGRDFYPTGGFIVRGPDGLIADYVYPPLVALLTVPWTLLPVGVAEVFFQVLLIGVFVATLALLGVRDWRCYGLAFLWPPVTDAVATGNISIILAFAAALVWAQRDRVGIAGPVLGASLAAKTLLWPLTAWLAATSRLRGAVVSVVVGGGLVVVSWALVGFRGLTAYPDLVRRLTDQMDEQSYTLYALGVDVGLAERTAWTVWLLAASALLAASVVVARRGDERRAFVLALAAGIAFTPIVWLHYFVLLLVMAAVVQPRLGPIWFLGLPLHAVVYTRLYNGSTWQTASVLAVVAVAVAFALAPSSWRLRRGGRYESARATTVISSSR